MSVNPSNEPLGFRTAADTEATAPARRVKVVSWMAASFVFLGVVSRKMRWWLRLGQRVYVDVVDFVDGEASGWAGLELSFIQSNPAQSASL